MEVFSQEEMYTTGEYGPQLLLLKITKLQLEDLIVNLEHNLCQFGRLFFNLLTQIVGITNLNNYYSIKNIRADSIL